MKKLAPGTVNGAGLGIVWVGQDSNLHRDTTGQTLPLSYRSEYSLVPGETLLRYIERKSAGAG